MGATARAINGENTKKAANLVEYWPKRANGEEGSVKRSKRELERKARKCSLPFSSPLWVSASLWLRFLLRYRCYTTSYVQSSCFPIPGTDGRLSRSKLCLSKCNDSHVARVSQRSWNWTRLTTRRLGLQAHKYFT